MLCSTSLSYFRDLVFVIHHLNYYYSLVRSIVSYVNKRLRRQSIQMQFFKNTEPRLRQESDQDRFSSAHCRV